MALRFMYPYKEREDRILHYSDEGFTVIRNETESEYAEAVDPYPSKYTYRESNNKKDLPIEEIEKEES